jgi:hypothetical protein
MRLKLILLSKSISQDYSVSSASRSLRFSTVLNILKKRPISAVLGILPILIPGFVVIILMIVFSSIDNDAPKVDLDLIHAKGVDKTARIIDIETQYNISINGVHPTIIHYSYNDNGQDRVSKYRVLEDRKIQDFGVGTEIDIKLYQGSSIILGLKPYNLEKGLFLLILFPFLVVGAPFLAYSVYHLLKEIKLYKHGNLMQGRLISSIQKRGLPFSNIGQSVSVLYEYEINGQRMVGESKTDDLSFVNNQSGDLIPIFVSNSNPKNSCMVPKQEAFRNSWNIKFE